jgi:aminopeptidase S
MTHSVLGRLALITGAVAIMGCGEDEAINPGALDVVVSPSQLTLQAGGTGAIAANVGRSGSFTGPITLTASGAPTGATIAFTNASIPSGSTASTGTVTLLGTTTPGTYSIIVTAAGTSVVSRADTMSLTVTAATP